MSDHLSVGPAVVIARLRRENHTLRDRVARLEEALGVSAPVPPDFRCGPATTRGRAWRLLNAFAAHGALNADQARAVLYHDRRVAAGQASLHNYLARVRAYLARHGIILRALHGIGWTLDADMQAKTQALVARLTGRAVA
jgi:hypothetical protein